MMIKFELKLPSTKSLKFIFTKMVILETLNILVANISRFTVIVSLFSQASSSEMHSAALKKKSFSKLFGYYSCMTILPRC